VLKPATVAVKASSPNWLLFGALGVLGGLAIALVAALFVEAYKPVLRVPEDISDIIHQRLVGAIPRTYLQGPSPRLNAPSPDSLQLS
jgi:capsular polysaccharide biosynthesis protein